MPAKVHVAVEDEDYTVEAATLRERQSLYIENAALKEALLQQQHQQQQNMNWLWQPHADWGRQPTDPWASQACVQPGTEIIFKGLKSAVELNGHYAVVERWDAASDRWVVRLPSGEDKYVKPENVVPSYNSWPAFCPGAQQPYAPWQGADRPERGWQPAGRGRGNSGLPACTRKGSSNTSSFASDTTAGTVTSSFSSCGSWEGGGNDELKTTVMMRNLPNDYTREMLLSLLDREGFQGCYDLIYLPIDYHSKVGFGYAFINLVSHAEAERLRAHFADFAKWDVVSQKVCEVCWSSVLQGVQAHIDRYRNSPVMHDGVRDEFKPVLFQKGVRVPFPGPTKSVRAPRARRRDSR